MYKYVLAWVPMVPIAIANALLRERVFAARLGELRAHQASTASCVLLFAVYIWVVTRICRPESTGQAFATGLLWLGLTVAFEFLFGRYMMGHPWGRLFHDYNVLEGRVWVVVLAWITLAPYAFYRLSG